MGGPGGQWCQMIWMILKKRSFVCSDFPELTQLDSRLASPLRIVRRYFYQVKGWTVKMVFEVCFDENFERMYKDIWEIII